MKRLGFTTILVALLVAGFSAFAATPEQDARFMQMAVTVAQRASEDGRQALGAVAAMRGAWKASGEASATATPEQDLADKSAARIKGATIYTVVQPTGRALDALTAAGVAEVVYAIGADKAVSAGIYSADDYSYEPDVAPMRHMPFAQADALLK